GDERGCGRGVGHRQRRIKLAGRERQRLGVGENGGQRLLTVVDRRRCGKRAGDDERRQHDTDGEDAARGGPEEPPAWVRWCCRRPRRKWLGRRVRQLLSHVRADLMFFAALRLSSPDCSPQYKRILRVPGVTCGHSSGTSCVRVPILNACEATGTAGCCRTTAPLIGASTARPDCYCGHRDRTAHPRSCCSSGRRGVT